MTAYYNEFNPYAAEWLRNLIRDGLIAPGEVDQRSIEDVAPDDLRGFAQCHFFAGIGGWSYALRQAGWPDDKPIWTGSCPCQSFSSAGKRGGVNDNRHLWPSLFRLIRECRPPVIFGEQVASSDVVGRAKANIHHLQSLQIREALRSLQNDWQAEIQGHMPRLPKRAGAKAEAQEPYAHSGAAQSVETGEPWLSTGFFSARPVPREEFAIRSDGRRHSDEDRRGALRDDRHPLQSGWGLECTVSRSDRPLERVHNKQRSSGHSCAERDDEPLGACESFADSGCVKTQDGGDGAIERLIKALGGQLEEANRPTWLGIVSDDLDRAGYTLGAHSTPSCSVGAPHIRQRLYWGAVRMADATNVRHQWTRQAWGRWIGSSDGRPVGGMAVTDRQRRNRVHPLLWQDAAGWDEGDLPEVARRGEPVRPGPTNGFWSNPDWLFCRDDKWRPVEPGSFPLVDGLSFRLDSGSPVAGKSRQEILRGIGNAINAEHAAEVIRAFMEVVG